MFSEPFAFHPHTLVNFVGGGGKTSSMFRLAAELASAGFRVVTTTTTHISEEQARIPPASIAWDEIHLLKDRLDKFGHCLLSGPPDGKGRILGASSELIHSLHARSDIEVKSHIFRPVRVRAEREEWHTHLTRQIDNLHRGIILLMAMSNSRRIQFKSDTIFRHRGKDFFNPSPVNCQHSVAVMRQTESPV